MRLAVLLVPSVLVTAALAVVMQQHYTKLKPSGNPEHTCRLNGSYAVPPEVVSIPFRFLQWCGAWCKASTHCSSFCLSPSHSACELYSSIVDVQYNTSTATVSVVDLVCYSGSASVYNILGRDTAITTSSSSSSYPAARMTDHVYHPCLSRGPQSFQTQNAPSPWVRFDFGKEETVAQIYITAYKFVLIDIRLGNSVTNSNNSVIVYVDAAPEISQEFRVPLTKHYKGRYLSFSSRDGSDAAYIAIGEVRVLRAFG